MTLREYFSALREQWRVLVATVLAGVAIGGLVAMVTPPVYSATVKIYLSAPAAGDLTSGAYEGGLLAEQRTSSYTDLVTSRRVLDDVISRLDLQTAPDVLRPRISAEAPLQTVLLNVTATDSTAGGAVALADATADSFMALVSEVERPTDPNRPPPVQPRVIERPQPPAAPTSPNTLLDLGLGAAVGLLLGLGLALLRSMLDTRVRSVERLRNAARAPVLASISENGEADGASADGSLSESDMDAYWRLWTNLRHAAADSAPQVLLVASPRRLEGRTTTACGLALVLADTGSRVLLLDADLRHPTLASRFGLPQGPGLAEVLDTMLSPSDAIRHVSTGPGSIDVLTAGATPQHPTRLLGSHRTDEVVAQLKAAYTYVVVDCPPVLDTADASVLARHADSILVLARSRSTRSADVEASVEGLEAAGGKVVGTALTRVTGARTVTRPDRPADVPAPTTDRPGTGSGSPTTLPTGFALSPVTSQSGRTNGLDARYGGTP